MSHEKKSIGETGEKNRVEAGTLYLVATPIGNLSDLSERAKKVLSEVGFVAAEDTRNTGKLLACFGIKKELISYFEHNKRERGEIILDRVAAGESAALVTDAGMPAISDPGEDIVRLAAERGIPVKIVPGCCAAVSALALSALSTGRFAFEGFLSTNRHERNERLSEVKDERRTMIFYEAPHKLKNTLRDLCDLFGGERKITLCREMTKINEETVRTTLAGAVSLYETREPRGEYVLVVEGAAEAGIEPDGRSEDAAELAALSPAEHVAHYLDAGMSKMDAVKAAAKDRGTSKSEFYDLLQKERAGE
ncbi:MAG: 16S rRNA (cytidine(1402)-2'-O)-methyltransferase [Clostridia bacterium]|nr:16S rRNA (cytidine(1402)-2'-O)-methyltransferase [Clostridia bacterium]